MVDLDKWRAENTGPVTLTNGCFDLLHYGHVSYLEEARALTGRLIVGVNGDQSVKRLKGPARPLVPELDRMRIVAALRCVDAVCLVTQTRMDQFIRAVRPTVWVKGGDYTVESLDSDEVAAAREVGATIRILPLLPGRSTSALCSVINHVDKR